MKLGLVVVGLALLVAVASAQWTPDHGDHTFHFFHGPLDQLQPVPVSGHMGGGHIGNVQLVIDDYTRVIRYHINHNLNDDTLTDALLILTPKNQNGELIATLTKEIGTGGSSPINGSVSFDDFEAEHDNSLTGSIAEPQYSWDNLMKSGHEGNFAVVIPHAKYPMGVLRAQLVSDERYGIDRTFVVTGDSEQMIPPHTNVGSEVSATFDFRAHDSVLTWEVDFTWATEADTGNSIVHFTGGLVVRSGGPLDEAGDVLLNLNPTGEVSDVGIGYSGYQVVSEDTYLKIVRGHTYLEATSDLPNIAGGDLRGQLTPEEWLDQGSAASVVASLFTVMAGAFMCLLML